jgi:hypothetical protein
MSSRIAVTAASADPRTGEMRGIDILHYVIQGSFLNRSFRSPGFQLERY